MKLLKSLFGVKAALLPRFPRPLGVRESNSSVGESQNLENKKKCFKNEINFDVIKSTNDFHSPKSLQNVTLVFLELNLRVFIGTLIGKNSNLHVKIIKK